MNIVDFGVFKAMKDRRVEEARTKAELRGMEKAQLLQELLHYNDKYRAAPNDIALTIRMQLLVEVLEERAELAQLRELSREFSTKLRVRLRDQIRSNAR